MGMLLERLIDNQIDVVDISVIVIGLLIVILLVWLYRRNERKLYLTHIEDYEKKYNGLKSIPISFKFTKAKAIASLDESTMEEVTGYQDLHDKCIANLKQIAQSLANAEDSIHLQKLRKIDGLLDDIKTSIELAEKQINDLNSYLDVVLEKENDLRVEITACKDRFRNIKNYINEKNAVFSFCIDVLEQNIAQCEKRFTLFEEWMYATKYDKANEEYITVKANLDELDQFIEVIPSLIQEGRGVVPAMIEQVGNEFSNERRRGIFLDHLDIPRNLELVQDTLKEDIGNLKNGKFDKLMENFEDYKTRLNQLHMQIEHESKSFDELTTQHAALDNTLKMMNQLEEYLDQVNAGDAERMGIINIPEEVDAYKKKRMALKETREDVLKTSSSNTIPASTILVSMKELEQEEDMLLNRYNKLRDRLESNLTDEMRAIEQLMKLQLVTNEIQVKVRKHRLPIISEQYHQDLYKAYEYTSGIKTLLAEMPLNVNLLNSYLEESREFIYKLHGNVNNTVGVARWAEDAIVYGNRYRSASTEIDSHLTRAELSYRSGDYSDALKVAIEAIEIACPESKEIQQNIEENSKSVSKDDIFR